MSLTEAAFIVSVISLLVALYILAEQHILRRDLRTSRTDRENHGREEIYRILRQIHEVRQARERIRNRPLESFGNVDKNTEILFMNKRVIRIIKSLSYTLSLYNEYLAPQFIRRVNDAINGYDFILNRLDILPFENDDPANTLVDERIEVFIDELKELS